ncbi:MAG: hypothetical protein LBO74_12365 [Candidatus Symbiothrix sp.]|jgi:hypothetical protein|nr:hypothetical protein [Candidatus Symbiothrix sp.]
MKTISLKVAWVYYNKMQKRILLEKILKESSKAVQASSMEILKEFENIN